MWRKKGRELDPLLTGPVVRCSFCNKSARDVAKMVAGPRVFICSECIDICQDVLEKDLRLGTSFEPAAVEHSEALISGGEAIRCAVCEAVRPLADSVQIPDRGWLCWKCGVAVRAAVEARL